MQSNIVWNVENQKKCQLEKLSEVEKLKLKIVAKKWKSNGMKFVLLALVKYYLLNNFPSTKLHRSMFFKA